MGERSLQDLPGLAGRETYPSNTSVQSNRWSLVVTKDEGVHLSDKPEFYQTTSLFHVQVVCIDVNDPQSGGVPASSSRQVEETFNDEESFCKLINVNIAT
jgi:hypothetical protein